VPPQSIHNLKNLLGNTSLLNLFKRAEFEQHIGSKQASCSMVLSNSIASLNKVQCCVAIFMLLVNLLFSACLAAAARKLGLQLLPLLWLLLLLLLASRPGATCSKGYAPCNHDLSA
jgi:hypothetical protein